MIQSENSTYRCCLKKFLITPVLLVVVLAGLSPPAFSQRRMEGRNPPERMERLQQFKKLRLMEVLNLNEEESVRFFARYNKFEEQLRDLDQERNVIVDDLEKLVKQGDQGEAFQKDFDELLALGQKVADARIAFYNEVRGLLSPQQVAKFLVFERNFNRDLRDIIQDVQRERRREFRPR